MVIDGDWMLVVSTVYANVEENKAVIGDMMKEMKRKLGVFRFITNRSEGQQRSGEVKGKEHQRQRQDSGRDSRRKGGNRLEGSRGGEKRGRIGKGTGGEKESTGPGQF